MALGREEEARKYLGGGETLYLSTSCGKLKVLGDLLHDVDDALLGREGRRLLAVVAEAYSLSDVKVPRVWLDLTEEHTEEGGLPYTILADDTDLVIAAEDVVEVLQEYLIAKALIDVVRLEDLLPDTGR